MKIGVTCGAGLAVLVAATLAAGCEQRQDPGSHPDPAPQPSASPPSTSNPEPPAPVTSYEPAPREFDHAAMQDAVHQILTEYHQIDDLGTVICPPGKPVEVGLKFHCTATIAGEKKQVPITVTSDEGDYRVGAPQ